MSWQILEGDALARLRELDAESVQTCVTSPPYWGLRDYGTEGQLGLEPTPEEYVANLVAVFREVRRVLRDDGTVFLNLGDSYYSDPAKGGSGTPNGRNARGEGYGRALRGGAYGKPGKAPEDSPVRDCLCGSLCDACRVAYRTGKAHSDGSLVPTPESSPSESSHAHTESECDRPPTSDSTRRENRTEVATQDQPRTPAPADEQPRASQGSTLGESSQRPQDQSHQSDTPSACQLCGRSLGRDARESDRRSVCTCGTSATQPSSVDRSSDTESSDGAYRDSSITSRLKPKDLCGIPWRVAFALQADGWWLRSDIIWAKPNPMPESVTDRPTRSHEYLFLLTKSPRYYYDQAAIAEPSVSDHDSGNGYGRPEQLARGGRGQTDGWRAEDNPTRIKRSVWTVGTANFPDAHFATFPPKLVEPCILAGSPPKCCGECGAPWERVVEREMVKGRKSGPGNRAALGDVSESSVFQTGMEPRITTTGWRSTCGHKRVDAENAEADDDSGTPVVLDPFAGSGTTGLVALRHDRSFIGIELNPDYCEMARNRIRDDAPLLNVGIEAA